MIAQTPSSLPSVSGGGGAVDHVEISARLRLERVPSDAGCLSFGGAAVFHVGIGDRLRFSSSSGSASELRLDDTGAVLLVARRESSDIDGRRTRDDVRTGSSVLTDLWSPRPLSARSAAAWPRCLT